MNFIICAFFAACIVGILIPDSAAENCEGQHKFYQDLGCVPHRNGDCPYKYKCKGLKTDLSGCWFHGHRFRIDHVLTDVRHDQKCVCQKPDLFSRPSFVCTPLCPPPPEDGCYRPRTAVEPCSVADICLEKPEDRPTCMVDGKVYLDGEYFEPASNNNMRCYCDAYGYNGTNVEPFCKLKTPNFDSCRLELSNGPAIVKGCAPVYEADQSPEIDCPLTFRCPSKDDKIERNPKSKIRPGVRCTFGDITMNYNDILLSGDEVHSEGVECSCKVGPLPLCQRRK